VVVDRNLLMCQVINRQGERRFVREIDSAAGAEVYQRRVGGSGSLHTGKPGDDESTVISAPKSFLT
jgi:hypothetical protein